MNPNKNKNAIILASVVGAALALVGYRVYKNKRLAHIAVFRSSEAFQLIENSPFAFSRVQELPERLKSLEDLPARVYDKYCANTLYSQSTTSTTVILDQYFGDIQGSLLYVAEVQTQGLGRTGPWQSPVGCLMFTYKYSCDMQHALPIQLIIPMAIIRSIRAVGESCGANVTGLQAKWPNDIYLQGRKLAGILVNSKNLLKKCVMSIGIGINVNNLGENISLEELFPNRFSRGRILSQYFIEFDQIVQRLGTPGWEKFIEDEYREVWMHYKQKVRLTHSNLQATAVDISCNGVISAKDDQGFMHTIHSRDEIEFF